ncbi:zinc-finger domain-containing protein [Sphingomicrobium sediminis]|uniref:Zinc-finger domain-containing protein n=1 Tax=Sphingomicrobium sediminis TaxID=2950949 RepID=A0A9X2EI76_9SPHN|nr:zinc-finger domain-containing protein [Sphingomicrobium sediminis]MCM8558022.1 zinc-finger domain-containing protein [Sphingomicrobium sediminis]
MSIPPPETVRVSDPKVNCDGATEIDASLGHPRVYYKIDEAGFVECKYCDRRFVLVGGPADDEKAA